MFDTGRWHKWKGFEVVEWSGKPSKSYGLFMDSPSIRKVIWGLISTFTKNDEMKVLRLMKTGGVNRI